MKKAAAAFLALFPLLGLAAQEKEGRQEKGFNSMNLTGVTGLYTVPTAHLSWENANTGLSAGYHANFKNDGGIRFNDLFQFNASFFRWVEIAGTYDGQPYDSDDDALIGIKVKIPVKATNLALGANISYNNIGIVGDHIGMQFYGAVTYDAELFTWPAATTLVAGKTLYERDNNSDIDFGMGFDLVILPRHLRKFLHWLIDFSNFSYSPASWGQDPARGILNTGLRVDLSQIPVFGRFKFAVDVYVTDAFDHGSRALGAGAVFGMRL